MLSIGIIVFILMFAAAFYLVGKRAQATRCSHCGKSFAMREVAATSPLFPLTTPRPTWA